MAIHPGDVLLRRDDGQRFRVVHKLSSRIAPDRPPTHVVVIELRSAKATPRIWTLAQTQSDLAEGLLVRVVEPAPVVNLAEVTEAEATLIERRWALVQRIKSCGPQIYDRKFRGQLAADLARQKIASKPFFYSVLRQYLQDGPGKQALAAALVNCGAPGKERVPVEGAPKPGRPRRVNKGLLLTAEHRRQMFLAFTVTPKKFARVRLEHRYFWMLSRYYFEHIRILPSDTPDATSTSDDTEDAEEVVPRHKIVNPDCVPTLEVFRYHYNKLFGKAARALKRLGRRRYDLANKPQLTGTLTEVANVGDRYYIDATVLDVYVVSRFNRSRIVGRPTLYLVVDQLSRLIVGMHLGLEPPSYVGALLALYNCSVDKVSFCAQYKVEIAADEWPTGGMPLHLMGDRGEGIALANDRLTEGFGIEIDTARPYAGDAKGVGERAFHTLQATFGNFIPGYVDKEFIGRDAEPAALQAALDIVEITATVIRSILLSNTHVIRGYEASPEQIAAGVPSVPIEIWRWCVKEYRYSFRQLDLDYLKRFLWPRIDLKTMRQAFQFCTGLYFQGEPVSQQDWFHEALRDKTRLEGRYHPLYLDSLLVLSQGREGSFTATPTPRSERFAIYSHSELMALRTQSKLNDEQAKYTWLGYRAGQQDAVDKIVTEAKAAKAKQDSIDPMSKAERMRGIRANRAAEIHAARAEAHGVESNVAEDVPPSAPLPSDGTDDAVRKLIEQRRSGATASP